MLFTKQKIPHILIILYTVTLLYCTQIRLYSKSQKSSVIGTGFHHNCKIGKLECTIIYIQSVNIVLDNTLCSIPLAISIAFIDLHQNIKGIHKNVTAAHARINYLDFFRFDIFIFFPNRFQLFLNIRFLLCLIKVVFPSPFQFFILMSFYPQSSDTVLYHIAHNPVRCKKLCSCRNTLLSNFHILFQQRKCLIFRLCIIILVHPSNDFNLSGWLSILSNITDIKIIFLDVMCQMIYDSILISDRYIQ